MTPLNEPLPGADTPAPVTREPWERVFDAVLLVGIAVLAWNALVVSGVAPGSTLLVDLPLELWKSGNGVMLAWVLTAIPIIDFVTMYLMLAGRFSKRNGEHTMDKPAVRLAIQAIFTAVPWLLLAISAFVKPQSDW